MSESRLNNRENSPGEASASASSCEAPLVSIIVPVYNCAEYLDACITSILSQTYDAWELICVNDGSADDSLNMLHHYAAQDSRVQVIDQDNAGPGRARNVGIERAQGEYILFVDADDYVDKSLLEKAVSKALMVDADIVAWDIWFYNNKCKRLQHPPLGILHFAPYDAGREYFSWEDNPDQILLSFQNWPWNKLFKTAFVNANQLTFKEDIVRTEDVSFVCAALVKARRIACVSERLSFYRVCRHDSAMATKDQHALDFFEALLDFKLFLEREGLFEQIKRSYDNWALSSVFYNIHSLKSFSSFCEVFTFMKEEGFEKLGLFGLSKDHFFIDSLYDELQHFLSLSVLEYLFRRVCIVDEMREDASAWMDFASMDKQATIDELFSANTALALQVEYEKNCASELKAELDAVLNAKEQKVGAAICYVPRVIQRTMLKRKNQKPSNQ